MFAALGLLVAGPADALHRESPGAIRLSDGGDHVNPSTRSWANWTAFSSTVDLLGTGLTERQIFLFNLAYFDCENGTVRDPVRECPHPPLPPLTQSTAGPGTPDNPTIDAQGKYVAFDAAGVFNGNTGGAATRRQIFLLNRTNGELLQLTHASDGDSVRPSINRIGTVLTFESSGTVTNGRGSGVPQIFAYRILDRQFVQVTSARGPSQYPMLNGNGDEIVFESTARVVGDGSDTGIPQIFAADIARSTLVQITNGNAPSRHGYMSEKGGFVAFESLATNLPGETAAVDGHSAIYEASTKDGNLPDVVQRTSYTSYGDCSYPALDQSNNHLAFLCSGDPLQNGTQGSRLFAMERNVDELVLYQLTGRGEVKGPITHNVGQWFLSFVDNVDLTGRGACGFQLHIVNYYNRGGWNAATQIGQLPPDMLPPGPQPESNLIGKRTFELAAGDAGVGSRMTMATHDGQSSPGTIGPGKIGLYIGPRNLEGEAAVTVFAGNKSVSIPPTAVDGLGVVCLEVRENGSGLLDCDGGREGAELEVEQDHIVSVEDDPACVSGCREGLPCQLPLPGPHRNVCNGPIAVRHVGTFGRGDLTLRLPVNLSVSLEPGGDGEYCKGVDDLYGFQNLATTIELTTAKVTARIANADAEPRDTFSTSDDGAPLDCALVKLGDFSGTRLVGHLPVLDVPTSHGLRDMILRLRLEARPPITFNNVCQAELCEQDADCDDENPCNGVETCVNQVCSPGSPTRCDDGNACNGIETCDRETGDCLEGRALECNDGNPCTADTCNQSVGCVYASQTGPCDDNSACTDNDTCRNGACSGRAILVCDNGNPCDGVETCDSEEPVCLQGTRPSCDDGNPCTTDSCQGNVEGGCVYDNNTARCDDGSACTNNDTCRNGACEGTPVVVCSDDPCNPETCDPVRAVCVPSTEPECDDGNPCTDDSCTPGEGCVHEPNTAPCDDGDICTSGDQCRGGECGSATPNVCDDGNPCNGNETCNPTTGECGDGRAPTCNDFDACTEDRCDSEVPDGCFHRPIIGSGSCDTCKVRDRVKRMAQDLERATDSARVEDLGGERSHKRFTKLAAKARRKIPASCNLKKLDPVRKLLLNFMKKLDNGEQRGRIDPGLADTLRALANEPASQIKMARDGR